MKIVIAGGPRTGKSTYAKTLSEKFNIPVISTDDFISFGWSESILEIIKVIDGKDDFILEGVNSGRTIRKLAERNINLEFDKVYFLDEPHETLTKGQATMTKGCKTVWQDVVPLLDKAGIDVFYDLMD